MTPRTDGHKSLNPHVRGDDGGRADVSGFINMRVLRGGAEKAD